MVIIEAFACGTPVIASKLGALPEVIMHGRNGLLFKPKDPVDLASKAAYLWAQPQVANELGREARLDYEARFTPKQNYEQLLKAYAMVREQPA
jgi:glycosyltransferase involved in cell wall biosynthesis